jgi:hypothetical protein
VTTNFKQMKPAEILKEIVQEMTKLFEAASFDTEYHYLFFSYDPTVRRPVGTDPRPDIETVLDGIARDSPVLRLPESIPMGVATRASGMV